MTPQIRAGSREAEEMGSVHGHTEYVALVQHTVTVHVARDLLAENGEIVVVLMCPLPDRSSACVGAEPDAAAFSFVRVPDHKISSILRILVT